MVTKLAENSTDYKSSISSSSGFDYETQTYHSLRQPPPLQLPDQTTPLSVTHYVFTLYNANLRTNNNSSSNNNDNFLVDAAQRHRLSLFQLQSYVTRLSSSLRDNIGLKHGDTAFILSPNSIHVPLLYLSLFAIGVIVSPSNPTSSPGEISRQMQLTSPVIAFATSETAHKLPSLKHPPVLLDSLQFHSLISTPHSELSKQDRVIIRQSDVAAVLYSSGTTGRVKGVALTHRNLISSLNGALVPRGGDQFSVTNLALAPPLVVAMISNSIGDYDLRSLQVVLSGGAPLSIPLMKKFNTLFPNVTLVQAYGLTETTGGVCRTVGPIESKRLGANGRLTYNCQAKIVDPLTGVGLPPFKHGELWIRGPSIMKGYVHDEMASGAILTADGWLKTGDLCYFDNEGFLFYVDSIKELIKCNGYQVPPAELEDLLQSHPDIVEAAVVPYPDEKAGQVPIAFVVRTTGSIIDESIIKEFVAKEVAPYKKLRRVSFMDSIPKNATGKVLRKELVKLSLSNGTSSRL
uniref:Uncharacterized protein n=1 Tax=Daucus carota subsp. sativus TaxID=79200 RepID=A0A175YKU8_DAUCS